MPLMTKTPTPEEKVASPHESCRKQIKLLNGGDAHASVCGRETAIATSAYSSIVTSETVTRSSGQRGPQTAPRGTMAKSHGAGAGRLQMVGLAVILAPMKWLLLVGLMTAVHRHQRCRKRTSGSSWAP